MQNINVAKDFTEEPGLRYKILSEYSGELFRESLLLPKLMAAIEADEVLFVDLDDTYGYPPSFLEESFGGLCDYLEWDSEKILSHLQIKSEDEPSLITDIDGYIKTRCKRHYEKKV